MRHLIIATLVAGITLFAAGQVAEAGQDRSMSIGPPSVGYSVAVMRYLSLERIAQFAERQSSAQIGRTEYAQRRRRPRCRLVCVRRERSCTRRVRCGYYDGCRQVRTCRSRCVQYAYEPFGCVR